MQHLSIAQLAKVFSRPQPPRKCLGLGREKLRVLELPNDTFEEFQPKILEAVGEYPGSAKLVGSMAKRCQSVLLKKGLMADC